MCKESSHTEDGEKVRYLPYSVKNGPDDLVRRPGKTQKDKDSGAWQNHVANRQAKIDENRNRS